MSNTNKKTTRETLVQFEKVFAGLGRELVHLFFSIRLISFMSCGLAVLSDATGII